MDNSVMAALQQLANVPDKPQGYEALLNTISATSTSSSTTANFAAWVDSLFTASLGIVATRPLLTSLIASIRPIQPNTTRGNIAEHALTVLESQSGGSSYEEINAALRDILASIHEAEEEYAQAAQVLAGIPLESSQRKLTNEDKVRLWIRIVRNYLEIDDTTSAESFLNKAKNVMYTFEDAELHLHFKLSQSRIQDARREFLAAAQGYLDISLLTAVVAEEERLHTLSMAIKCAVLAPAGPARSRALGRLYKDERAVLLEEYGILEKMYLDRLIAPGEVAKFAEGLAPHQLARTADGSTVLARAVVEHNLLGASRLYANIGFDELGLLLGLDGDKAEETTARMIEQGRLVGKIDQIARYIWFEREKEASGVKGSGRAEGVVGRELRRWDGNVQGLTEEVEKVTSQLQVLYPVCNEVPTQLDVLYR